MIEPANFQKCAGFPNNFTAPGIESIKVDNIITNPPFTSINNTIAFSLINCCDGLLSRPYNLESSDESPSTIVPKKLSSENSVIDNMENSRTDIVGKNYQREESKSGVKTQVTVSRLHSSSSVEESVEVQEYLQEEEIEDANKNLGDEHEAKVMEITMEITKPLSLQSRQGLKILWEIMSDSNKTFTWPFLDPVDASLEGCHDYYDRIEIPMWLRKMEQKFEKGQYTDIIEFVSDMRLMVDNCYQFNGAEHSISRKAHKIEILFNQKVALLSRDLREKIADAVPPRNYLITLDDTLQSRGLINRKDLRRKQRELKRQRMIKMKLEHDQFVSSLQSWDEGLFDATTGGHLKAMWELPQLGLFLFLCSRPLNLNVSQYELERCFILSKESSAMQRLMTSLFSSANQRTKLHLGSLMPARVWEEKMKDHLSQWFKLLMDLNCDVPAVSEKLAIDEHFFKVFGLANPLTSKSYHELTYYQKVWIVKSVFDHLLDVQKSLLDAIEKQDIVSVRPHELGCDSDGNTYLYFSQFCEYDVRIYRQSPLPTIEIKPPEITVEDVYLQENYRGKKRCKRQPKRKSKKIVVEALEVQETPRTRDSRLRQNLKQLQSYQIEISGTSSSECESDSDEEVNGGVADSEKLPSTSTSRIKYSSSIEKVNNDVKHKIQTKNSATAEKNSNPTKEVDYSENKWTYPGGNIPRRSERKIIEESIKNAATQNKSKVSKSLIRKNDTVQKKKTSKDDWKALAAFMPERNLRSRKSLNDMLSFGNVVAPISKKNLNKKAKPTKKDRKKSEDEISSLAESKPSEKDVDESLNNSEAGDSVSQFEISNLLSLDSIEEKSADGDDLINEKAIKENDDPKEFEEVDTRSLENEAKDEVKKEGVDEVKDEPALNLEATALGPNLEKFELVAESVQGIRNLVQKFKSRIENVDHQVKPEPVKGGIKKNCEKLLLENLDGLLKDLEPRESRMNQILKRNRTQLRKEQELYKEPMEVLKEEVWGNNELAQPVPGTKDSCATNSLHGDTSSDAPPVTDLFVQSVVQQQPIEVKKKNIFESDFDMALVLSQGRVLRKRNNVQTPPVNRNSLTTRSRRLLNRPSRYKDEEYVLDDDLMASACTGNSIPTSTSKKLPDSPSPSASVPSRGAIVNLSRSNQIRQQTPESLTKQNSQASVIKTVNSLLSGSQIPSHSIKHNPPSFKSQYHCASMLLDANQNTFTIINSIPNMSQTSTVSSSNFNMRISPNQSLQLQKNSAFSSCIVLVPSPKAISSPSITLVAPNPTGPQSYLNLLNQTRVPFSKETSINASFTQKKDNQASLSLPTDTIFISPTCHVLNSTPLQQSVLLPADYKVSGVQLKTMQNNFAPAMVLNKTSGNSSLKIPSNNNGLVQNMIVVPKIFNPGSLNQPSLQRAGTQSVPARLLGPPHISSSVPVSMNSQIARAVAINPNMIINLQNVKPTLVSINSSGCANSNRLSLDSIVAGTANIQSGKNINVSPLATSKIMIPLKYAQPQVSGNTYSLIQTSQANETPTNVANLLSILNSNSSVTNSKYQGNRVISHLPLQVGQLNPGNGHQIVLVAPTSSNQVPTKHPQNLTNPIQLQRFVLPTSLGTSGSLVTTPTPRNSQRFAAPTIIRPVGRNPQVPSQNRSITPALIQQLARQNSLSISNVTHQLVSPGLVSVTSTQPVIRSPNNLVQINLLPNSRSAATIPIILNKEINNPNNRRVEGIQNLILSSEASSPQPPHISWLLQTAEAMNKQKAGNQ